LIFPLVLERYFSTTGVCTSRSTFAGLRTARRETPVNQSIPLQKTFPARRFGLSVGMEYLSSD
jgi:hypothetical protein